MNNIGSVAMVTDLFRVMDLNMDGHIDLTELIQMVALTCRGSNEDPHKCKFHALHVMCAPTPTHRV